MAAPGSELGWVVHFAPVVCFTPLSPRFLGGWVSGYVWYLELSREPKHAAQQMRYQNVDLSNGLGTIIIF